MYCRIEGSRKRFEFLIQWKPVNRDGLGVSVLSRLTDCPDKTIYVSICIYIYTVEFPCSVIYPANVQNFANTD